MKIETVHPDRIDWQRPEWADEPSEALVAYANGYELEIGPSPDTKNDWDWILKVTAEISETPEVIDTGTARSQGGAKWNASHATNRDQRLRTKAKTAGAMLEAVEAKVAAEVQAKSKKKPARKAKAPEAVAA